MTAVLVVDDAPALAASCAQALAEAGYAARAATSVGAAFIELADALRLRGLTGVAR
jgi:DNA-binding response OmpR family regulator